MSLLRILESIASIGFIYTSLDPAQLPIIL
jgi:hypothetical protein